MSSQIVRQSCYRPAKPIPEELCQHCTIFFDERLYINALNLLTDILTLGTNQPNNLATPAFAPLPFHIELASVLLIHPRYTNQAVSDEHIQIPSKSIIFLRNLLAILGPINANLADAFSLTADVHYKWPRRRGDLETAVELKQDSADSTNKIYRIKGLVANEGRIRRCATDFWHVVGWSLNCSIKYPQRWKYLKVWLQYMLDVLDADWSERERHDQASSQNNNSTVNYHTKFTEQSMIIAYLSTASGRTSAARRIVKALFADGSDESLRNFPEVFPNEIEPIKICAGQKRKCKDSIVDPISKWPEAHENDLDEVDLTMNQHYDTKVSETVLEQANSWMGGNDAIILRQRLIALLSKTASTFPHYFIDVQQLHDLIYDYIRPLPLPFFTRFISSADSSHLPEPVFISLTRTLLSRLIKSSVNPDALTKPPLSTQISQTMLEQCYLPFPALSASPLDNAKVSYLLENLVRLLCKNHSILYSATLAKAVELGIGAREKTLSQRKKKGKSVHTNHCDADVDSSWLKASSARLRYLLSWLKSLKK